jgi:hypothetical protein
MYSTTGTTTSEWMCPSLRLFEIRPTFHTAKPIQAYSEMETGMDEKWKLSAVMTGDQLSSSLQADLKPVDFFDLKAVLENILETLGVRGARILAPNHPQASGAVGALEQALKWFHPGQSAVVLIGKDPAGVFGRIHPGLDREMKLKSTDLDVGTGLGSYFEIRSWGIRGTEIQGLGCIPFDGSRFCSSGGPKGFGGLLVAGCA